MPHPRRSPWIAAAVFARRCAGLLFAAVALAGPGLGSAAPVSLDFEVTSQPALDAAGITYGASGGAVIDSSGPVPVVRMAVTSSSSSQINATSSVLTVDLGTASLLLQGFVYTDLTDLLFSDVTVTPDGGSPLPLLKATLIKAAISTIQWSARARGRNWAAFPSRIADSMRILLQSGRFGPRGGQIAHSAPITGGFVHTVLRAPGRCWPGRARRTSGSRS